jgi:hypothetical protein
MKGGRGVWVPKLGIFTFTAMNVDLAVSTIIHESKLIILFFRAQPIQEFVTNKKDSPFSLSVKTLSAQSQ